MKLLLEVELSQEDFEISYETAQNEVAIEALKPPSSQAKGVLSKQGHEYQMKIAEKLPILKEGKPHSFSK